MSFNGSSQTEYASTTLFSDDKPKGFDVRWLASGLGFNDGCLNITTADPQAKSKSSATKMFHTIKLKNLENVIFVDHIYLNKILAENDGAKKVLKDYKLTTIAKHYGCTDKLDMDFVKSRKALLSPSEHTEDLQHFTMYAM